ncbi:MAG: putative DNA-binding domain-containing protein [Gammaproteobacteria bacterium]
MQFNPAPFAIAEMGGDFRALQFEFTAHIRDPENNAAPAGIEDRRLGIYRELLYRNVEGFIANSFPVLRSIIPDEKWHTMVRRYFAQHRARTPLFPKLPQEFLHYLADPKTPNDGPPYMQELAHYEWLELEASLDKRELNSEALDENLDCLNGIPVLNPIARAHAYQFPVHRVSPTFQPTEAGDEPTYLVVYRDRADKVAFMLLNPITARLIDLIVRNSECVGRSLLHQIAEELAHPDPDVVIAGGAEIMDELCARDVLLGARKA